MPSHSRRSSAKRRDVLQASAASAVTAALLAGFGIDKAREARAGSWTCSSAAAARDLGFCVAKPLEERLRQTVDWYREHGWL